MDPRAFARSRLRASAAAACFASALGCSGSSPVASTTPSAPAEAGPFRAPPPCRTAADCLTRGTAALDANAADARALLRLACDKQSAGGCLALGSAYATGGGGAADRDAARRALEPLCSTQTPPARCGDAGSDTVVRSDACVIDACAQLVELEPPDAAARLAFAERGCAIGAKDPARAAIRARACLVAAHARTAANDAAGARQAQQTACALGSAEGCEVALSAKGRAPTPAPARGATLEMPRLETDGIVMRDVSCQVDGNPVFGLFGGVTLAAGFVPRKAALRACSPRPYEAKLHWVASNQRVVELGADAGDPKLSACVEKALRGAASVPTLTCDAILVVGAPP